MGAAMRQGKAHLRTRVETEGMNYKGFNIAVHELGHNVEQTFSLNAIDHYSLNGVPNTAFTEALAFVFQGRDLELLGLQSPDSQAEALKALNDFWATFEICGVSLVDMRAWHWMYEHPQATPVQLRDAVLQISQDVWNKFYAPVLGGKDVVLLGIYSHMIDEFLYLPDYPLGHMIAFQLEEHMKKAGKIGPEFERVARLGRLAPDLWMKKATGAPVGPEALLAAAEHALTVVGE
jgi:oligoendopeptidase F